MANPAPPRPSISTDGISHSMSRHGTPTSGVGRLGIEGSSSSSGSVGMPVTTRSGGRRGHSSGHRAASGSASQPTAGPSTPSLRRSGRQAQQARQRPSTQRGRGAEEDEDVDDRDDGDDGDEDDPAARLRETIEDVVAEIMSVFTPSYLTPHEFRVLDPDSPDNDTTDGDRHLRRFANILTGTITTQRGVNAYRATIPQDFCVEQLVQRAYTRYSAILRGVDGRSVRDTIIDFRRLCIAIATLLHTYREELSNNQDQRLARVVVYILHWIGENNKDILPAHRTTPAYASPSTYNPYQYFRSGDGQPSAFVNVLRVIPIGVLRAVEARQGHQQGYIERFLAVVETYENPHPNWVRVLRALFNQM